MVPAFILLNEGEQREKLLIVCFSLYSVIVSSAVHSCIVGLTRFALVFSRFLFLGLCCYGLFSHWSFPFEYFSEVGGGSVVLVVYCLLRLLVVNTVVSVCRCQVSSAYLTPLTLNLHTVANHN
jgi:hypothetical protein